MVQLLDQELLQLLIQLLQQVFTAMQQLLVSLLSTHKDKLLMQRMSRFLAQLLEDLLVVILLAAILIPALMFLALAQGFTVLQRHLLKLL